MIGVQISSVMGMTISRELLLAIYPLTISLETLKHDLKALEASGFLTNESPTTWSFAQVCETKQCQLPFILCLQKKLNQLHTVFGKVIPRTGQIHALHCHHLTGQCTLKYKLPSMAAK